MLNIKCEIYEFLFKIQYLIFFINCKHTDLETREFKKLYIKDQIMICNNVFIFLSTSTI